jgi:hypothetical protein
MNYDSIIAQLENNKATFQGLLKDLPEECYMWKSIPGSWCLLEIVCHLLDEEREDFRTRLRYALDTPELAPPMFDPLVWVTEREYIDQDYNKKLDEFIDERDKSVKWLRSLKTPKWDNAYQHPKLGRLSAHHYISNWLAHDYLHIRQIINNKHGYLKQVSNNDLEYAGVW